MGTCQGSKTSETGTGNIKTAQRISPGLQRHFDIENAKVEKFMSGQASSKSGGSLTMDNGQILERYTLKEMQGILKETKDNGYVWSDDGFSILYNDGSMSFYAPGDDISKVRTSGIKGVIYENGSTTAYAGSGVKIENLNQTEAFAKHTRYGSSKYEDDWRMDFEDKYYQKPKYKG